MAVGVRAAACALAALSIVGCGAESKSGQAGAPTVSLWISATAKDYRQVAAGAKLALAQRGGRAGVFRINYAGKQVSDDAARATTDALTNARASVQDTQAGAVITDVGRAQAEPAITLLNEAGIPTVTLGDAVLKPVACSDRSDIYPNGHATAITIPATDALPLSFRADFLARLGFPPSEAAWGAYQGARAVLAALATSDVATDESPPRLDRDALAAELVRAHGGCA